MGRDGRKAAKTRPGGDVFTLPVVLRGLAERGIATELCCSARIILFVMCRDRLSTSRQPAWKKGPIVQEAVAGG